ncbi:MAG: NAD(P)-dependent oxidoreductase [Flavobacteriales bacterium]|nr:NAD(P)-dependent oxidoreductase [Flavobacteriales bacterium]MAC96637.1 NAD(P)-dependent oxidoreductase [Flavobacteriales bacterium]|tara:strand:- start:9513 stop:10271 length:759 start_codon:yes stop_codon:yes gene_type:complete
MNKIALITGATSGIGKACAELYAKNQYNIIITGRREERLSQLKAELESTYSVEVLSLCFDVRSNDEVVKAFESLTGKWKSIDVLVNNAGLAKGLSSIQNGDLDHWEQMIDTNVKGLLYVSKAIMPLMIELKHGHIVNVGSIAGKEVYPNGNVYCATKHAVDALTKAMRIDLLPHKIKVSAVCPGAVDTEFSEVRFDGDKEKAEKVYLGYEPLKAEDIADAIYFMTSRPAHVNINDLLIMPTAQASATQFDKN